jgi:signal transduction histidine kinase/ligand-binding sensor domain-containing protein
MFRLPILAIALLWCFNLNAQMMPFKNYGTKDGLSNNNVQATIRDDRGLLWVGTDFGIYWFDGKKFYQPNIKSTVGQLYVTGFYKDRKGVIWILTFFNGLYKYQNGHFNNYLIDTVLKEAIVNTVSDMVQISDNKYVVVNQNYPFLFDGKRFSVLDPNQPLQKTNSVTQLADKTIVLGTDNGVFLYRYKNGKALFIAHFLDGHFINKVLVSCNKLYVMSNKGVLCFQYNGAQSFSAQPLTYLKNKPIKDITASHDSALWVVADNGSFWALADSVFKIKNGKIFTYSQRNGLPENIQQIYCDEEGLIWFANRKGISMMGDAYYEFNKITNGGSSDPVTSLLIDDKKDLWVGTVNGVALKKGERYKFYLHAGKDSIKYVSWLTKTTRYGSLAGTDAGVFKIADRLKKKFLSINSTTVTEGSDSSLWFGGQTGEVWNYNGKILRQLNADDDANEMITAIYAGKHNLWVGFREKGIFKYKIENDSLIKIKEYSPRTGYPDMRIRCCACDKNGNVIWGTRTNGILIFNKNSERPIIHINNQNGLNASWVRQLSVGADGRVYLATNNGINIISGDYKKPLIKYIKINDDNINRETNCIQIKGDIFYIGTNEGILKWMPANIHKDTVPPAVYFTKIGLQGLKQFQVRPYTSNAGIISLSYYQHFISFEFAGISLKNPENVLYHYILNGQDADWGPLTDHNTVDYDLKPGNYTFKVAAENADGVWSRHPAVFHFIINPPFWQAWWFIILVAAVLLFAAYSAYRYKLSKALALEMLRNKISSDLHDDIGSTLSSISILSEVATREKEQKSKQILAEINERSHMLMEKMDDIVWSISTRNDTVGNLFIRVQQFASTVLEAKDIDYEVRVPENVKGVKLDMQSRQHIYLIMKEAINNLIKYSQCTTVCIVAEYADGLLKIEVADDGKGFDAGRSFPGNGLLNMRKRANELRGELYISSAPGKGTRLKLVVEIE